MIENEIIEPYGFIYITTNIINGRRYIGQKKFQFDTPNEDAWKTYLGSGTILKQAIEKYGKENFYKDIVDIAYSKEELDLLEIEWINNYNACFSKDFYNISEGGKSNPLLGKTKDEIKIIKQKQKTTLKYKYDNHIITVWNKGKKHQKKLRRN